MGPGGPLWYVTPGEKPRLTFGAEMEFQLGCIIDENQRDPDENDGWVIYGIAHRQPNGYDEDPDGPTQQNRFSARQHVANTLNNNKIKARAVPPPGDQEEEGIPGGYWTVKHDSRVASRPNDGRYDYQAIEVTTPAYYYTKEAIQELLFVITLLSNTYRCSLVTGLHVHVGNGEEGFTAEAIQNLVMTYFVFEKTIELIHPRYRINHPMCQSLQTGSRLMLDHAVPVDEVVGKRTLEDCWLYLMNPDRQDIDELWNVTLVNHKTFIDENDVQGVNDRPSLNLKPIATKPKCPTVEFRQHGATFDVLEIENWVRVCVGLLEFADTATREKVGDMCYEYLQEYDENNPCPVEDFLRGIGMPREARYFANADGKTLDHRDWVKVEPEEEEEE